MGPNTLHASWLLLPLLAASSGCSREAELTGEQARLPKRAFEMNLAGLLSRHEDTRRNAMDVFRRSWPAVRHHVPGLAKSSKEPERFAAAYLLAELGTTEDLDALRHCLDDSSAVVRRAAMAGILRRKDRGSLPRLVARSASATSEEQGEILDCLRELDPATAETRALELVRDAAWAKRLAALPTLAKLTSPTSAQAIVVALEDPTWTVRVAAADAAAARKIDAAPRLRALLQDTEWQVRAASCRALAALRREGDAALVGKLALEDASKYARREATRSLGSFAPEAAVPGLRRLFNQKDVDEKVLANAVEALAGLEGAAAEGLLAELRQRPDPSLQQLLADWELARPAATPHK